MIVHALYRRKPVTETYTIQHGPYNAVHINNREHNYDRQFDMTEASGMGMAMGMEMEYSGTQGRGIVTRNMDGGEVIQMTAMPPQMKGMPGNPGLTPGEEVLNMMDQTIMYQNEMAAGNAIQVYHHSDLSQSSSNAGITMFEPPELDSDSDLTDNAPYMGKVLSRPVTLKQLLATIKQPGYLETEFRKLPPNHVDPSEIPPGAEKKNRFSNVLPCLRTRVPLGIQGSDPSSDYINASFVKGYEGTDVQYVATQAPMATTIDEFWIMVWEHKAEIITMATNFEERGFEKCERYWPSQGSQEYGKLEVTLTKHTAHTDFNEAILALRHLEQGETRVIRHYKLTFWPEQGVPDDTRKLTDFLQEVKMADSEGPALVHCSAGIGRTGVIIAVDIGIQAILQGDERLDILRIVSSLRRDRPGAVQTREQYRFIHQVLYNFAVDLQKQTYSYTNEPSQGQIQ
ncbi:Tyrosine-protein phosphatase non-receptor type 7-like [Oopsacas minuta]|uniref:protein-tyrosine-phosphatase n=1 Tax=Oopsacas minuta TaxID=111878 RepID=A0AAV7JL94_9METZ|nr:Tyrosine-protein phosphatase non-receptor type 7-like [Oopsacas minuta]